MQCNQGNPRESGSGANFELSDIIGYGGALFNGRLPTSLSPYKIKIYKSR